MVELLAGLQDDFSGGDCSMGSGPRQLIREFQRRQEQLERNRRTLFVGNLPVPPPEEELRLVFAPFGKIRRIDFPRNAEGEPPRPRGFGFIEFEEREEAVGRSRASLALGPPKLCSLATFRFRRFLASKLPSPPWTASSSKEEDCKCARLARTRRILKTKPRRPPLAARRRRPIK